jgi:hypothetical protein
VAAVLDILQRLCKAPGHHFWTEDVSLLQILQPEAILSSGHITDAYLLGLAVNKKGKLATFDSRIPADAVRNGRQALELIS